MRVLIITNHMEGTDGWSRYSLDLANELERRHVEIVCVVSRKSRAGLSERVCLAGPMEYLCNMAMSRLDAQKMQSVINEFRPDAIHVVVEPYLSLLPFIEVPDKTRIVATMHGTYAYIPGIFRNPIKKAVSALMYLRSTKKVDKFIIVSDYTKNKIVQKPLSRIAGVLGKMVVIKNAIDFDSIKPADLLARVDGRKHVLFVGAIKPRKGIANLIRAFHLYNEKYNRKAVLDIVGSGDMSNLVTNGDVRIHGRVKADELDRLYSATDAFALLAVPNKHTFEGFGLVYLEANARGVPTLGSRDSGASDAIVHGKTGYLADDPYDIDECAWYLHKILDEKAIMPGDCIEWAKAHDVKLAVDKIISQYQII
ncbi:glycosyltransferase family 4 protein [Patescibacteria group bacterium]|nr:glycosyltransferase family 4 protein [Patescibacteria group bacterium]MDE1946806.1 glycosyltransferase family 4 protein [Patescibacteria group bacterium]MDE2011144.1 glycosyltransferase family 4 protein [Patescibacteria group bacterium]MDE2233053.1 glycosyltransferase family 4 protein [Patescibacteria group bacterium]